MTSVVSDDENRVHEKDVDALKGYAWLVLQHEDQPDLRKSLALNGWEAILFICEELQNFRALYPNTKFTRVAKHNQTGMD